MIWITLFNHDCNNKDISLTTFIVCASIIILMMVIMIYCDINYPELFLSEV
jgi:hypothetical protein